MQTLTIFNLVAHRSLAFDLVPHAVAQCCLAYSPRLLPDPSGVKLHSGSPVVDLGAACWGHFVFGSQTGLLVNE